MSDTNHRGPRRHPITGDIIRPAGPWNHTQVSANGASFHLAIAGEGPLILLLHGFPMYWWTWRNLIPTLADAGFQVAAMDLRGYGGSDHSPRGYDPFTTSSDVVGVIRSLGYADAIIIGHGWGGFLAWTTAALHPDAVRAVVPVAMAHPRRLRDAILKDRGQLRSSSYVLGFQRPWIPERALVADDAARIGTFLRDWSATPTWPSASVSAQFRRAFGTTNTAHCALEYHRWALRSIPRADGRRFVHEVSEAPIAASVLHIHGAQDRTVLPRTALGSREFTQGPYAWRLFADVGHFVHEEAPDQFAATVLQWLDSGMQWCDPTDSDPLVPH